MREIRYHWHRLLMLGLLTWFGSFVARVIFLGVTTEKISLINLFLGGAVGLIFDLYIALVFSAPFFIAWLILPLRFLQSRRVKWLSQIYFGFLIFFWLFAAVSEWTFVKEFNSRFNFIAVDYLVYTHEVIQNIWQSYPVIPIVLGLIFLSAGLAIVFHKKFFAEAWQPQGDLNPEDLRQRRYVRFTFGLAGLGFLGLLSVTLREDSVLREMDPPRAELAKNSVFTLFAAYQNNEIDFKKFYIHESPEKAQSVLDGFKQSEGSKLSGAKKMNVVIVLMESMSAPYLDSYGSANHVTPNLDRLTHQGLWFSRMYATGTRTVRGIEAVMLSVPPTPGQSIVRRPGIDGLFHLGSVFQDLRYKTEFIYGGHATFDNMGPFFASNGFEVVDQDEIESKPIAFKNAWGVSDEDIFQSAVERANRYHAKSERFLQVILTTSNHRPYTFPEGRIKRKSGAGREAAVEYSDWAIGDYLKKAESSPWFENTLFVFAADHQASVAGGTRIEPEDYLIPVIFYSPKILRSQEVKSIASQVDIAPTLLGLLNLNANRPQFGQDLLRAHQPRAFLATYQKVAYWEGEQFVVLEPNRRLIEYSWRPGSTKEVRKWQQAGQGVLSEAELASFTEAAGASSLWLKAVGLYSLAYDWYKTGKLKALAQP